MTDAAPVDRRAMRRAYKEGARLMGVLQIRNVVDGRTLLIRAMDVPARINRERAQLQFGSHPHKGLQADWQRLGPDAFTFEVLDLLAPSEDQAPYDAGAELLVLEQLWAERMLADGGHPGYQFATATQYRTT